MEKSRLEGYISQDTGGLSGRTIADIKKEFPNIKFISYQGRAWKSKIKNNPAQNTWLTVDCYIKVELPREDMNKFKRKYKLN